MSETPSEATSTLTTLSFDGTNATNLTLLLAMIVIDHILFLLIHNPKHLCHYLHLTCIFSDVSVNRVKHQQHKPPSLPPPSPLSTAGSYHSWRGLCLWPYSRVVVTTDHTDRYPFFNWGCTQQAYKSLYCSWNAGSLTAEQGPQTSLPLWLTILNTIDTSNITTQISNMLKDSVQGCCSFQTAVLWLKGRLHQEPQTTACNDLRKAT